MNTGKTCLGVGAGETGLVVGAGKTGLAVGAGETSLAVGAGETGLVVGAGETGLAAGAGERGLVVGAGETDLYTYGCNTAGSVVDVPKLPASALGVSGSGVGVSEPEVPEGKDSWNTISFSPESLTRLTHSELIYLVRLQWNIRI